MSKFLNRIAPQDEVLLEADIGRQVPSVAQVNEAIAEERRNRFTADTEIRLRVKALEDAGGGASGYAIVDFGYSYSSLTVQDRTITIADLARSGDSVSTTLPPQVEGKARDFLVVVKNCLTSHELKFEDGITILPRDGADDNLAPEEGTNVFMFTEIMPNTFLVSRTKVVEA